MNTETNNPTVKVTGEMKLTLQGLLGSAAAQVHVDWSVDRTLPASTVAVVAAHVAGMRALSDLPDELRKEARQLLFSRLQGELARFALCAPPAERPGLGVRRIRRTNLWSALALVQWALVCARRVEVDPAARRALMMFVDAVTRNDGPGWPDDDVDMLLLAAAMTDEIVRRGECSRMEMLPPITRERLKALRERVAGPDADASCHPMQVAEWIAAASEHSQAMDRRGDAAVDLFDLITAAQAKELSNTARKILDWMGAIPAPLAAARRDGSGAPATDVIAALPAAAVTAVVTSEADPELTDKVANRIEGMGIRVLQLPPGCLPSPELLERAHAQGAVVVFSVPPAELEPATFMGGGTP